MTLARWKATLEPMLACAAHRDSLEAPLFTTTGDVVALVSQLETGIAVLNADVDQRWPAGGAFVTGWRLWRDRNIAWIGEFRGYWTYLAWNQYDVAAAKLAELKTWRESYERAAGRGATGPGPVVPPGAKPIDLEGVLKTGLLVAAVGGAVAVGVKLYAIHKTRKAILGRGRR